MNVHVSALREQHERYRAVRERLWFTKPQECAPVVSLPEPVKTIVYARRPAWKLKETCFDHHVQQYKNRLLNLTCKPHVIYIQDRCRELGVSYDAIIVPCRRRIFVRPRQIIMAELRDKFGLSFPRIGQLFGGLDHTTVIASLRRVEILKARGEL
jgi:hypothetical protein